MIVVLAAAMMVVMMLVSHGGRHHEQPTAPGQHGTSQDTSPPPTEDRELSRPTSPAVRESDPNPSRSSTAAMPPRVTP